MKIKRVITIIFLTIFLCTGSFFSGQIVSADEAVYNSEGEYAAEKDIEDESVSQQISEDPISLSERNRAEEEFVMVLSKNNSIREEADLAVEKYEKKKSLKNRWTEKKVNKNIAISRKYLSKGKYSKARKYAYRAYEISPDDINVATLLTKLNKAEMFGSRMREEKIIEFRERKTFQETGEKEDPLYKYNEPAGMWGTVLNMFSQKVYRPFSIIRKKRYSLEECVNIALSRSQRKIVAEKQIHLAEMKLWEVRRELFPEVSAKYELSSGKISSDNLNRHYRGRKYGVETKHTIFDGFEKWYNVKQSQLNYEIVKLENEKIDNEIMQDTKEAYYNLDKSEKALAIHHLHKERINDFFVITENVYNEDVIPKVEYLKVKGQKMQVDFQYTSSAEDVNLAHMILFQTMDMEPDPDIGIFPMETPETRISIGLENCYKLAYANRPDFKIKEKMIEHYEVERKKMKAKGWPKLDFHGSFGAAYENFEPLYDIAADQDSDDAGNPTREGRTIQAEWFAGVTGSVPLWGNTFEYNYVREKWAPTVSSFRGSTSATSYFKLNFLDNLKYFTDIRDSRVGFESAKLEYLDLRKDIAVEVKEAYFKYRKSLLQNDVSKAQLEHQRAYMEILEERRRYGEMEISRVIEEYDKLVEYEYGNVQADASYFISLSQINKAIGVSNYFIPVQERRVYEEWEKEFQDESPENASSKKRNELSEINKTKNGEKYIRISEKYLAKGKFKKAIRYANKASGYLGTENDRIAGLNAKIAETERSSLEEKQKIIDQKNLEKEAERIRKEREQEEKDIVKQNEIAQKNMKTAKKYYYDGKYGLARKYVAKALSAQPKNADANELLRVIKEKLSDMK